MLANSNYNIWYKPQDNDSMVSWLGGWLHNVGLVIVWMLILDGIFHHVFGLW